jgi:hypothetical protein
MNDKQKQIIIQWIKNLRSGRYKQGESQLRYKAGNKYYHCCLGVLCSILKADWNAVYDGKKLALNSKYLIPNSLIEKHDLSSIIDRQGRLANKRKWNVMAESGYMYEDLTELNDSGVSFDMIADIIEVRLLRKSRIKLVIQRELDEESMQQTVKWSPRTAEAIEKLLTSTPV